MTQGEDKSSLDAKFDAAVRVIRSLPEDGPYQPSDNMMLMFYSYYQQATLGPCDIPRPISFWDSHGKAKWDAWSSLGTMTKEEAMMNYVDDIQLILETIPISEEVSELMVKLGHFYTEVDGDELDGETEVEKRAFTRPFAAQADELKQPFKQPLLEGFGGLWNDIQNPGETAEETNDFCMTVSNEDNESNRENISQTVIRSEGSSGSGQSDGMDNSDGDNAGDDEEEEEEMDEDEAKDLLVDFGAGKRVPDSRLLMEDRRWGCYTGGSASSTEPSVSSVTNGVHSSLNSEAEDGELASLVPRAQRSPHMHLNGHASDNSNIISEKNYRAPDSDNEEFCDSMEDLAMEEGSGMSKLHSSGSRSTSERRNYFFGGQQPTFKGQEDVTHLGQPLLECEFSTDQTRSWLSRRGRVAPLSGSPSPGTSCGSQPCVNVETPCCCLSQCGRFRSIAKGNVNEQIATALLRLQGNMADVLHRLHTLEVLTVAQSRSPSPRQDVLPLTRKFRKFLWWPFHFSPISVVLMTVWPLVAHWLVQLCLQQKRRKIS